MRLPKLLRRMLSRGHEQGDAEKARYKAADDLERSTQSHYRSVTGSDSQGRSTKNSKRVRPGR
jgi:hypothetical protein